MWMGISWGCFKKRSAGCLVLSEKIKAQRKDAKVRDSAFLLLTFYSRGYTIIRITLQREDAMSFFGNRRQAEAAPTPIVPKPQLTSPQQTAAFETVLGANS